MRVFWVIQFLLSLEHSSYYLAYYIPQHQHLPNSIPYNLSHPSHTPSNTPRHRPRSRPNPPHLPRQPQTHRHIADPRSPGPTTLAVPVAGRSAGRRPLGPLAPARRESSRAGDFEMGKAGCAGGESRDVGPRCADCGCEVGGVGEGVSGECYECGWAGELASFPFFFPFSPLFIVPGHMVDGGTSANGMQKDACTANAIHRSKPPSPHSAKPTAA
jgi:hypothetical protein